MRIIFLNLLLLFSLSCWSYEIKWLQKDCDMGTIKEEDGPQNCVASFVNIGKNPVSINNVKPACGCTDAVYTHGLIEPGDTAEIRITYNPAGRPGKFEKQVKVYIGEKGESLSGNYEKIVISGKVLRSMAILQEFYPIAMGPLRLESDLVLAGELKKGTKRHYYLNLYNQGEAPIKPVTKNESDGLTITVNPEILEPGEVGELEITLDYPEDDSDAFVEYKFLLQSSKDYSSDESIEVTVRAGLESWSKEKVNDPYR